MNKAEVTTERRRVLVVMCIALATVVSAVSSLNVALPDLARDTGATPTQLQWVVDAYALVFAGLLLFAGALGDRFGRRRALLAGLGVFGVGALVATTVQDPGALIAVRAFMGLGAALIMPATLSIITSTFPPGERDRAVGAWAGVAGGSALLGLLVSGALLEIGSWPSVFILGAVLAALAAVGTLRFVPAAKDREATGLDFGGAVTSALALFALVWAFIEAPERGWTDPLIVAGFAAAVVLGAAFVAWELRRREPMLDPRLFALRGFTAGSLSVFVQFFAAFGVIFVLLQFVQLVLGYSPLAAGAALAPMAVVMIAVAPRVPRLVERVGVRPVGPVGLALMAGGLVIISTMDAGSSYWRLLLGGLVLGLGMALAAPPATTAIVESLPEGKQGVASAVNDAAREVGGALGIAVLGSVLAGHVGQLGPGMDTAAFVDGFSAALLVGAAVLVAGAIVVALRAPGRAGGLVTAPRRRGWMGRLGFAAIAFSSLYFLSDVVEASQGGFSDWQLWLTLAAELALPPILIGLYLAQRPRVGRVGLLSAVAYAGAYLYFSYTVVYALVHSTPDFATLSDDLGAAMTLAGAVMVVAGIGFGWAVVRAGILPRWTGYALGVGVVLVAATQGAGAGPELVAVAVRDLAFVGMGMALFSRPAGVPEAAAVHRTAGVGGIDLGPVPALPVPRRATRSDHRASAGHSR